MSQRGAIASKSAISVAESSTPRLIENDFFKASKRQRPSGNDEENINTPTLLVNDVPFNSDSNVTLIAVPQRGHT